jgi:integrase
MTWRGDKDGRGAEQYPAGSENGIARARDGEDRTDTPDERTRMRGGKSHLALVAPTTVNGTVDKAGPPKRRRNAEVRSREYLTDAEVNRLISAAGENRNGHRDATMILVAYRHGLRAGELVTLRWDAVDFAHRRLHVSRLKGSAESVHPLSGRELRALRRLKRDQDPASPFIFTSERGAPFTPAGFRKMVARLGVVADFAFPVHPHMLRHACGYKLANDGVDTRSLQAYLGHRNIQHTVRYTELSPTRFKHFWHD